MHQQTLQQLELMVRKVKMLEELKTESKWSSIAEIKRENEDLRSGRD